MDHRYFRAGIGSVIYTTQGEVALFRRAKFPIGIWQFQQGGIDPGEHPDTALWRELAEETGLSESELTLTAKLPFWTNYTDLDALSDNSRLRLGQVHQWYFLQLHENTSIDLTRASDLEFDDWKFVTFTEAITSTSPHKRHVYEALYNHFITEVLR